MYLVINTIIINTIIFSQFLLRADALEKVVPLSVHVALQAFESRKSEIVNREIARSREATQLLNRHVLRFVCLDCLAGLLYLFSTEQE